MEKVFVLVRMWDKVPRGHETVERISTDIYPILEYIKNFSYMGKNPTIEMAESFNMGGICKTEGVLRIASYFQNSGKHICQHFIKVSGHKFDDPKEEMDYVMYRLQVRNIH